MRSRLWTRWQTRCSGHFARFFSFASLDIPVSDFALDPSIDRHVAQLNLDIMAPGTTLVLDWVHHRNAREQLEILPMDDATQRAIRHEAASSLVLTTEVPSGGLASLIQAFRFAFEKPGAEGVSVEARRLKTRFQLVSSDPDATPPGTRAALTRSVQDLLRRLEAGKPCGAEGRRLLRAYRAMTAETVRSRVRLVLPDPGLKRGLALPLNLVRRDLVTGRVAGGVALLLAA